MAISGHGIPLAVVRHETPFLFSRFWTARLSPSKIMLGINNALLVTFIAIRLGCVK
jgi:hypothetical protein